MGRPGGFPVNECGVMTVMSSEAEPPFGIAWLSIRPLASTDDQGVENRGGDASWGQLLWQREWSLDQEKQIGRAHV